MRLGIAADIRENDVALRAVLDGSRVISRFRGGYHWRLAEAGSRTAPKNHGNVSRHAL